MVEYALILILVSIIIIGAVSVFGSKVTNLYENIINSISGGSRGIPALINDFYVRILDFKEENGRWPKSWGEERFTEIGLDPDDWDETVSGVEWIPHGDNIGLGNVTGDDINLYVTFTDGVRRQVYTVIWCYPETDRCFYRNTSPENEVDITTLEVVYIE